MQIVDYVKNTRVEMSHVNWPSREQTIRFTALILAVSVGVSILLGASDFVFSKLLTLFF